MECDLRVLGVRDRAIFVLLLKLALLSWPSLLNQANLLREKFKFLAISICLTLTPWQWSPTALALLFRN